MTACCCLTSIATSNGVTLFAAVLVVPPLSIPVHLALLSRPPRLIWPHSIVDQSGTESTGQPLFHSPPKNHRPRSRTALGLAHRGPRHRGRDPRLAHGDDGR